MNKALVEIHKELDQKTNADEFRNVLNDQALINETLCTETIVGRWAWKTGKQSSEIYKPIFIQNR